MKRPNIADAHRCIARREDFDSGNLYGGNCEPRTWFSGGYLTPSWLDRLTRDRATYVVFSYSTPIFWVAEDGREVYPPLEYSVTTARHQSQVRRAMSWNPITQLREPAPYELEVA